MGRKIPIVIVANLVRVGKADGDPVTFVDKERGILGVMPVFSTREEAVKMYPTADILEGTYELKDGEVCPK